MQIHYAITKEELVTCFEVMKALRPHHTGESFLATIDQMQQEGYQLIFLEDNGRAVSVAGFRFTTTLYDGLIIDFDDFVTRENARGKGYAGHLFNHLVNMAKERSIKTIHFNAANLRFDAHRFYMNKKMKIIAHHFKIKL